MSAVVATHEHSDASGKSDPLRPARGVAVGLVGGAGLWAALAATAAVVLRLV